MCVSVCVCVSVSTKERVSQRAMERAVSAIGGPGCIFCMSRQSGVLGGPSHTFFVGAARPLMDYSFKSLIFSIAARTELLNITRNCKE